MSLNQLSTIDKIEIDQYGILYVRQRNDIQDSTQNNAVVASNFVRWTLVPGESTTGQDPKVIAVATAVWTPAVISAYQAQVTASQSAMKQG
jgi:hypothetical protein